MRAATIVMTGGSSGLGRYALDTLLGADARVLLGARGEAPGECLPLDLTDLTACAAFVGAVRSALDGARIDALVLNAGGHAAGRTAEGFDATFVLDYLGHYLIAEALWPLLADGARVVLTTSGTHDPAEGSRAPAPKHADARRLARPEDDPDRDADPMTAAQRAYASAKLCVVLYARHLAARANGDDRGVHVLAYDPGPTPGTGLARSLPFVFRFLWERTPAFTRWLLRAKANTPADAGGTLAALALGSIEIPSECVYAALRRGVLTWPPLSAFARDDAWVEALARDSAALLEEAGIAAR